MATTQIANQTESTDWIANSQRTLAELHFHLRSRATMLCKERSSMKIGELVVSNIRLAELIGATAIKPKGYFFVVRSKIGGIRYWKVNNEALNDGEHTSDRPVR